MKSSWTDLSLVWFAGATPELSYTVGFVTVSSNMNKFLKGCVVAHFNMLHVPQQSRWVKRDILESCGFWHSTDIAALTISLEGILKRHPEIGDRPKKVLSESIEPSRSFYRTPKKVLSNPKRFNRKLFWAPPRFYRTLVRGTSEPQIGFYRTFRIEAPLLGYPFKILPTHRNYASEM